ncbi:MAG: helix-turn-helix transcriptional regulator [Chlamydiia bacterium]|nr:helix-turn-helix transcriptional regulator [Chlamydiia bacterium]
MKDYLFRNNLSVKQLASDLEISPSYLYQLIRGERKPSLELAQKIESITDGEVTVGRLLGFEEVEVDEFTLHDQYHQKLTDVQKSLEMIQEKIQQIESRVSKLEGD